MKTTNQEGSRRTYQTPQTDCYRIAAELPVMSAQASTPEGYNIDSEDFEW